MAFGHVRFRDLVCLYVSVACDECSKRLSGTCILEDTWLFLIEGVDLFLFRSNLLDLYM